MDDLSTELPFSLEKRTEERSTITLRVDYKRLNTFFADYTKNISKGGTFIRTAKPLDVGTKFVFVLSFPSREGQLRLKGEVMWTVSDDRATDEQPPGMGIRFLFNDDAEREKVAVFVEKLMAEALGEHISSRLLKRPVPVR
ncbi:TIGR02266 family protein [Pendulispora rubella]|uniref:TIGR02266 family protein n=1 Tax=Pendulispora rubella TaxID=2741070 RepID=A0ABZ2LCP7_9BACT